MVKNFMDLSDRVAVVIGGTSGLGRTLALGLAEAGASVVSTGRRQELVEEVSARIRALGRDTVSHNVNVSDRKSIDALRDAVVERFGRVDVLVNAAGITDRGTIIDTSPELFDMIFNVNVRGPFFLMQETIKIMRREKIEGNIVNICSMSSKAGQPFIAAYCSSKGALATLTENTAYAVMRNRIRVNGLNIGWMATEGEDRIQVQHHGASPDWLKEAAAAQPFGRLVDPHEIARAVAFLSTDESGLMTGSMVNYDQSIWGAYDSSPQPESAL